MAMSAKQAREIAKRMGKSEAFAGDVIPVEEARMFLEFFPSDGNPREISFPIKGDSLGLECSAETWYGDHLQFCGELPNGQAVNVRLFWRDLPIFKAIRDEILKRGDLDEDINPYEDGRKRKT